MPHMPDFGPLHDNPTQMKSLSDLEVVRTRPGMYIGSTDHRGLHNLLQLTVEGLLWHYMFLKQPLHQMMIRLEYDGSATISCEGANVYPAFLERNAQLLELEFHCFGQTSLFWVNALCERLRVRARGPRYQERSLVFEQGTLRGDELHTSPTDEVNDICLCLWPDFTLLDPGAFDYERTQEVIRSFLDNDPRRGRVKSSLFKSHHRLLSWMSAMWLQLDYTGSLPITIIDARSHRT